MNLTGLVPMLRVPQLEEAVAYYCNVLGFESVNRVEGWACLQRDRIELMLLPNPTSFSGNPSSPDRCVSNRPMWTPGGRD
jgi:catechol 2,3-dioxygenase-like lactoylglutathione lyase family enzyme